MKVIAVLCLFVLLAAVGCAWLQTDADAGKGGDPDSGDTKGEELADNLQAGGDAILTVTGQKWAAPIWGLAMMALRLASGRRKEERDEVAA